MANGIGKVAEQAKELIVREIWDMGLRKGDRMPSCIALAQKLHIGKTTLFRSLKTLVEEGVLSTQDRVGFFVEDPRTPGRSSYQIALVIGNSNSSPETNLLSVYLQNSCAEAGCRCVLFHSSSHLGDTTKEDSLSAHLGLRQQIERGEIHGLLSQIAFSPENAAYLKRHRVPFVLCAGQSKYAALNTSVNLKSGIRDGLNRLHDMGCVRPLGITADCFRSMFPKNGCLTYSSFSDIERIVYSRILSRPAAQRPDGLFFSDAMACQFFYGILLRRKSGPKYCPPAVVLAPREHFYLKDILPADVQLLSFSMKELADVSVQLLLTHIRHPREIKQTMEVNLAWYME